LENFMAVKVLGVSGSPVPNSNTDRAVKAVLEASGLEHEFVKLSELHIRPCKACKSCVEDNVCKQEDDFSWLSKKVLDADALVIGAYSPYSSLDAFTKAFLERLWSLRHVNNFLRGKPVVTVVSGVYPRFLDNSVLRALGLAKLLRWLFLPVDKVSRALSHELRMDRMAILGEVKIRGNVPCLTCGHGNDCEMSSVKFLHGKNARASAGLQANAN
jgi:NAD(P)H-dependent FMN reductase